MGLGSFCKNSVFRAQWCPFSGLGSLGCGALGTAPGMGSGRFVLYFFIFVRTFGTKQSWILIDVCTNEASRAENGAAGKFRFQYTTGVL
jgi:hypothetical protein